MSSLYERLGLPTEGNLSHGAPSLPRTQLERQLREIGAGAPALNLNSECGPLAAEIAAFAAKVDDQQRIALILLIVVSLAALQEGSTRFPVTGPQSVEPMRRLLAPLCVNAFGVDGVDRIRAAIEEILTSDSAPEVIGTHSSDYKPLVYLQPFIYQHRMLAAEIRLAHKLTSLVESPITQIAPGGSYELLSQLNTHSEDTAATHALSAEQRIAIEHAATAPLTIISGGPGTGKTSIVVALLNALTTGGVDPKEIVLAAPTGKAANRIAESMRAAKLGDSTGTAGHLCSEPSTLHRLLGFSPTQKHFRHHRNNPLAARVVIVDEGSMLDLELMSHLLDAMRTDARLIILGDTDQLPSVSAGAILRDLMPPEGDTSIGGAKSVRLTRNYRTHAGEGGAAIVKLANAINAGDANQFVTRESRLGPLAWRASAEQLQFVGAEWLDDEFRSGSFLERWYAERVRGDDDLANRTFTSLEDGFAAAECESIRRIFERAARSRILCVTRAFEFGSERINAVLHRRRAFEKDMSPERAQFIAGEPVMVLRNDYARMLFNGDQGVVLRVQRAGGEAAPAAVFPRGDNFVAFGVETLTAHLELCYAMTVHKAQGSEFDAVAVMMPDKDLPILTREILYTAVSRARSSVTIVGARDIIQIALARRIERYSGLREQLTQCLTESQRG